MATAQQAVSYLKAHGNVMHAAITNDGVIATHWVRTPEGDHDDDMWLEEVEVFGIKPDGTVSLEAIRNWLGY